MYTLPNIKDDENDSVSTVFILGGCYSFASYFNGIL